MDKKGGSIMEKKIFSLFLDELYHLEQFKHVFQKSHYPGGLAVLIKANGRTIRLRAKTMDLLYVVGNLQCDISIGQVGSGILNMFPEKCVSCN